MRRPTAGRSELRFESVRQVEGALSAFSAHATMVVGGQWLLVAILIAVVFAAGAVNGIGGIGFAQLSAVAMTIATDPHTSIVLLSVTVPPLAALQARHNYTDGAGVRPMLPLIVPALIGVPIGVYLLGTVPADIVAGLLGVVTILYVGATWGRRRWALDPRVARSISPGVGLMAGVSNGMLGVSGPILGPFLLSIGISAGSFAFAISTVFLSMSTLRLADLVVTEQAPPSLLAVGLVLLAPALGGQRLGFALQPRIRDDSFRRLILLLLASAAVTLLARGVAAVHI